MTDTERLAIKDSTIFAGDGTLEAFTMCQMSVEDRLLAPSTAKFPWGTSRYTTFVGDSMYRVQAHVDAQNGLGALIRTNFTCEVKYIGAESWSLVSLDM